MPGQNSIANSTKLATWWALGVGRDGDTADDVVVAAPIEVGEDSGPHHQNHRSVAVVCTHHRAAHLDHEGPQRVQCGDIELSSGIEATCGNRARWGQHAITTHEFTGVVFADD